MPFYDSHELTLLRIITDRGTEYWGSQERHDYELYLALKDIDHSKTKAKSPQTNEICERFYKTVLDEFYKITFRKNSIPIWNCARLILTNRLIDTILTAPVSARCAVRARPQALIDVLVRQIHLL